MAKFAISKPAVIINDSPVAIIPNSAKFDEGEGETTVRTQSTGGGSIEVVISDNAEEKMGMISFDMANTEDNIELAAGWKKNPGLNVVEISGEVQNGSFSRVYNSASITNNYEVQLSSDGSFTLDWKGTQPV